MTSADVFDLLHELRLTQESMRDKQDELIRTVSSNERALKHITERSENIKDEELLGLNLEDVVEKLQASCDLCIFFY